ncbi:RTA1 domain-containing protein [Aspergillus alliaceus]|uniref:RTA1 domain-containing protein n=1 Tax=Petromyces alliaceus TaxID=209559 RepID=UPI0012A4F8D8|nr:putative RTA1 domain protein [Aspergillus alliaceus]KAB8233918.1 putative RTA1 domain protein [Aspergillus alliaceus]
MFTVLYAIVFVWHFGQTLQHKNLFLGITFSLGAFGEFGGWLGRAIAYRCPYSVTLLEEQLVLLILAPTFTTAGIYCILSMIVPILGREKSPLNPRSYLIIFIGADFLSLILQGIGGGMSASALSKDGNEWPGTYTMVVGIIFQLVSLCIFAIFFEWVMFRAISQIMSNPQLRNLCIAVNLSILFLLIRGVFRSVELLQGWRGYLFTHEIYMIVLDAVMVLLSLLVFNIFNPAVLIAKAGKTSVSTFVELRERSVEEHGTK